MGTATRPFASSTSRGLAAAVSVGCAVLGGSAGCNSVAGLDGLEFEGQGGSEPAEIVCGWDRPPTATCGQETCPICDNSGCLFGTLVGTFASQTLLCPGGMSCEVQCYFDGDCSALEVVCPPQHKCDLICSSDGACTDVTMHCGSGPCELSCLGQAACTNVTMDCGLNECSAFCATSPASPPALECHPQSLCQCTPCEP